MKYVYTVMLRKHGESTGLMIYQARAKSRNELVLLMKVQAIVPVYDILSITERPAKEFILGVLFPRRVQTNNPDIEAANGKPSFWAPIVCWLKRQHLTARFSDYGSYCKRCKGVFPE